MRRIVFSTIIFIASLLFTITSQANTTSKHYFDNTFYLGPVVGYSNTHTQYVNTDSGGVIMFALAMLDQLQQHIGYTTSSDFLGGFVGGLQTHTGWFYFAGEAFFFLSTAESLNRVIGTDTIRRASPQGGVALHLLPGVMVSNNVVIFVELGIEYDHVGIAINNNVESKGLTAFDLGAGARIAMTDNSAIRLQYEHAFFGRIPLVGAQFNRATPSTNRVELIITVTPKIMRPD